MKKPLKPILHQIIAMLNTRNWMIITCLNIEFLLVNAFEKSYIPLKVIDFEEGTSYFGSFEDNTKDSKKYGLAFMTSRT